MADSAVDICNLALGHVDAEGSIEALDASLGEEERLCSLYYEPLRKQIIASHPWSFATRQVALSLASAPATPIDDRWTYAYQYPSDCERFIRIINTADPDVPVRYVVIRNDDGDQVILTNEEDALGEYVVDVEDISKWDAVATMSLSWWLAVHIATPLTGSEQKRQNALQMYQSVHPSARSKDANERKDHPEEDVSWIKARD